MGMNKKFILTEETMIYRGRTLHRIKAVRSFSVVEKGDLGGWVQSEDNLSHKGNCWIYDEAKAMDNSRVKGNARMYDDAKMFDNAIITDNAILFDNARMYDDARMFDDSIMFNNSIMYDTTRMSGNAEIRYEGTLYNTAELGDDDELCGKLCCRVDKFIEIFVPKGGLVTGVLVNGEILYNVGCQIEITKEEFINNVKGDKKYLKVINMIEIYLS